MTTIELETVRELIDELNDDYTAASRDALDRTDRRAFEDYAETVGARAALAQLMRRLNDLEAEALIDEMDAQMEAENLEADIMAEEEADARAEMDAEARAESRAEKGREEGRW